MESTKTSQEQESLMRFIAYFSSEIMEASKWNDIFKV